MIKQAMSLWKVDSETDSQLLNPEVPFHCSSMKKSIFSLTLQDEKTEVLFSLGLVSYASFFLRRKMKSFDSSLKWKSQCFLCVFSSVDFQILVHQQALSSFKVCPESHHLSSPPLLALCYPPPPVLTRLLQYPSSLPPALLQLYLPLLYTDRWLSKGSQIISLTTLELRAHPSPS